MVYIGGYLENKIISLFVVHDFELGNLAHFQVLKDYRMYARGLIKLSLELFNKKVYVRIPALYQSVINFAKHSGFKEISVEKNGILKNGQYYDRTIMVSHL